MHRLFGVVIQDSGPRPTRLPEMPSMMAWIDGISVKLKVGLNCMMNIVIDQMGTQNFFMLLKIHLKKIQSYKLPVTNTWSNVQRVKLSEQILKCYAKSAGQAPSSKYVFFAIVFKTQSDNLLSQYFMLLLLPFVLSEVIMGFSWGLATSVNGPDSAVCHQVEVHKTDERPEVQHPLPTSQGREETHYVYS